MRVCPDSPQFKEYSVPAGACIHAMYMLPEHMYQVMVLVLKQSALHSYNRVDGLAQREEVSCCWAWRGSSSLCPSFFLDPFSDTQPRGVGSAPDTDHKEKDREAFTP